MKTLNFDEMEMAQGGAILPGTQAWCDAVDQLIASGFDFNSVDSGAYVAALYAEYCR